MNRREYLARLYADEFEEILREAFRVDGFVLGDEDEAVLREARAEVVRDVARNINPDNVALFEGKPDAVVRALIRQELEPSFLRDIAPLRPS